MLHAKSLARGAIVVAAAGLAAAGLSVTAAPAQAAPGGCEQFAFAGFTTLRASVDTEVMDMNFNSNDPTVNGPLTSPQEPGVTANIQGGIDANGHVELSMTPMGGDAEDINRFTGDIGPDKKIHGQFNTGDKAIPGETLGVMKCLTETPKNTPSGTNSSMVTVSKDSDVYDTPEGNRLEAPFFLAVDRQYASVKPCADNWCLLNIPELPGGAHGGPPAGQAWAYSGEGFLDVG